MQRFLRLFMYWLLNFVYLIAQFWPRKKTIWLFGAWNGKQFNDNPKHIYLYVRSHMPEVDAIWITRDYELSVKLTESGIKAFYYKSFGGILAHLRAGVVIFTHAVEWDLCAPLLARKVLRVQTWHGMPIKKIGYDDENGTSRKRAALIAQLFPYRSDHCDLVLAASPWDQQHYRTAFNVKPENVVITGYARNDVLVRSAQSAPNKYKRQKNIIYMPTLRGQALSEFRLFSKTDFPFEYADSLFRRLEVIMHVRLHPVQKIENIARYKIKKCTNIKLIESAASEDFYEKLGSFDVLVTDYSGIYFDYLLSGKPIIMAPLDIEEYLKIDRGLLYDYKEICPENPCMKWAEIFDRLIKISMNESGPSKRYQELRNRFHSYSDDGSAKRCTEEILLTLRSKLDRKNIA